MNFSQDTLDERLERLRPWLAHLRRRAWGALRALPGRAREFLVFLRLGRWVALGLSAAALLAAFRVLPVLYGRLALTREAAEASRRSVALGEDRVLTRLDRAAYDLGFTEAALRPGTFRIEYLQEEGIQSCAISYDFIHEVDFYGVARMPVRVHDRVVRPTLERLPSLDPENESVK